MNVRIEVRINPDGDDVIEWFVAVFSFHSNIYNKGKVDVFRVLSNVYQQGNNDKALQFYLLSCL